MIKAWNKMESVSEQREEPAKFNKNRVSTRVFNYQYHRTLVFNDVFN